MFKNRKITVASLEHGNLVHQFIRYPLGAGMGLTRCAVGAVNCIELNCVVSTTTTFNTQVRNNMKFGSCAGER